MKRLAIGSFGCFWYVAVSYGSHAALALYTTQKSNGDISFTLQRAALALETTVSSTTTTTSAPPAAEGEDNFWEDLVFCIEDFQHGGE